MKLIDVDKLIQEFEKSKTFEGDEYTEGINTGISWCTEDTASAPTVEAIPVEWIKNELIPKAEKLGATEYANNIRFVLEDWEAWKKYRG